MSNCKQLGPGIARNKGILEAKGDFLLFLDSDDEFYLTGIEKVADYINCFNGKPPDIVVFDCDFVSHNGAFLEDRDDLHFFEQSRNDLLRDYLELRVRHECMFFAFRRDFLLENNIKFRPGFHEDVDFVFESLLRAEKVELIREKVYKKYISKGQITSSFEEEHLHGFIEAYKRMWSICDRETAFSKSKLNFNKKSFCIVVFKMCSSKPK